MHFSIKTGIESAKTRTFTAHPHHFASSSLMHTAFCLHQHLHMSFGFPQGDRPHKMHIQEEVPLEFVTRSAMLAMDLMAQVDTL